MLSRIKQALTFARPQLHVFSREHPARSCKPSPARASLQTWVPPGAAGMQDGLGWASRLPSLPQGSQNALPSSLQVRCASSRAFPILW